MSRLISTSDLHNVVMKRKTEYGKLATLVDNIVEDMVSETPTAIRIPEGATNGDMFKAVFGYEPATDAVVCNKEDWCGASEPCNYCTSNPDKIGKEEDWWDKPYKKEAEE